MFGQFIEEWNVTVGPVAQMMAVDPDVAVLVDAVEFDRNDFAAPGRRDTELLAVPTDSGWHVAAGASGGRMLIDWPLDAPVMWQVKRSPIHIFEGRLFGSRCIVSDKPPSKVEALRNSRERSACSNRRFHC